MSMTYYAVTDDPNELAHYGVLGMKWGVTHDKPRHSGSRSRKPRSAAYKKAQSKLGKMMKSGIKKAEAHWKEYNSPKAKEARFMKKAMQQARNGTLKYGKLTDAQVRKVTDRLALERNARQLGNTENPRMMKRLKMAVGTGIVEGVGRGTASYINARFEGRGRTTAEIKRDKRMAKYESKERYQRKKAQNAANKEYYEEQARKGELESKKKSVAKIVGARIIDPTGKYISPDSSISNMTKKGRARVVASAKREQEREERLKQQRRSFDNSYYSKRGQLEAEKHAGYSPYGFNSDVPKLYSGNESYSVTRTTYDPPTTNVRKTNWNRKGHR